MEDIVVVGIDLAKSVFQVHGIDARGEVVVRQRLSRAKLLPFFAGLPRCLVGMETCASANHWARELIALGHEVRLMPPQYVKPYVKRSKNDASDAEAICEAVSRPTMRFVGVKSDRVAGTGGRAGAASHAIDPHPPADANRQRDPGSPCRVRDRCSCRAAGS